jgi:radical SAM superfamily enzyme
VMIGLPGQTEDTVCRTADKLAELPVHGVKLHQLMVIEGTRMAQWFREGSVKELSLERYARLVGLFLSRLRPEQCIHRIVAETRPERGLIAPRWSARKAEAVSFIHGYLTHHGIRQGMCGRPGVTAAGGPACAQHPTQACPAGAIAETGKNVIAARQHAETSPQQRGR